MGVVAAGPRRHDDRGRHDQLSGRDVRRPPIRRRRSSSPTSTSCSTARATGCCWPGARLALLVADAQLRQHGLRRSVPERRDVALVAEIRDADLARQEARGDQIAQRREEAHAVAELGLRLGRPGDVVEHLRGARRRRSRGTPCRSAAGTRCRATRGRRAWRSAAPAAGDDVVDELGRAGLRRAARAIVLRDDDVGERDDRRVLVAR